MFAILTPSEVKSDITVIVRQKKRLRSKSYVQPLQLYEILEAYLSKLSHIVDVGSHCVFFCFFKFSYVYSSFYLGEKMMHSAWHKLY